MLQAILLARETQVQDDFWVYAQKNLFHEMHDQTFREVVRIMVHHRNPFHELYLDGLLMKMLGFYSLVLDVCGYCTPGKS